MELEEFGRKLERTLLRMTQLRHGPAESGALGWKRTADQALDELRVSVEVLQAALTELRRRSDAVSEGRVALEREHNRYRDLFDAAPEACLVTDGRGVIREANRAASELLRAEPEELVGEPLSLFVHDSDRSAFDSELEATAVARGETRRRVSLQPRKGAAARVELHGVAVHFYDDEPLSIRWTARYITAPRRAAAEIQRLNRELEMRVFQRTAQLESANRVKDQLLRRLRAAQSEAESARHAAELANQGKAEFLAHLSHELRTPLNSVGGYAALLRDGIRGELTPAQNEYLDRILRSQRHMQRLIDGIMNFATLELGRLALDVSVVSVEQLLAATDDLVAPQLREKALTYRRASAESALTCRADRQKAVQILVNLVSNAVKFTDVGGTVEIAIERSRNALDLTVIDSGPGIAEDQLHRVFDPFVRLPPPPPAPDSPGASATIGTGLGLTISRDLARAMGGELTVESTPGHGSRFTLSLPYAS